MSQKLTTRSSAIRPARRVLALSGAALAASLLLAGCSSAPESAGAAQSAETTGIESSFELADGWAKAGDGMTGVFGTLTNTGSEDLNLVSVDSPAAGMIELHETVTTGANATMREKEGGFVIPAGGTFELVPGGDHIMFMDLPKPLLAGDEVELTLTFSDGESVEMSVLVKDYEGAQENYENIEGGEGDMSDMEGMDHGGDSGGAGMSSDEHAE